MKALVNDSVTFYSEGDTDLSLLRRLCEIADKQGIRHGSVNVFMPRTSNVPGDVPVPPFVWFQYAGKKEIRALLNDAGVFTKSISFARAKYEEPPDKIKTTK